MRAVLQRVKRSSVAVDGRETGRIDQGWLVLLGIAADDGEKDVQYLADKTVHLRAFRDENDKMNLSVKDIEGSVMVISNFTLYGDCRKGRRPSFTGAAPPEKANELYESFVGQIRQAGIEVATGTFQAYMQVDLLNDGPVTLLLDSRKNF